MALHFKIESVTKTPQDWHINLSIIDDAAPTVVLDHFNVSVIPTAPASVTAAKNLARSHWQAVQQLIADQANTRDAIQNVLNSIEQGG
jgi:hypothetical protein